MKSIQKDMGVKDFNIHFKNVPDIITTSFTDDNTLLWKGQESIHTFKFDEIRRTDLLRLATLLSDKTRMDTIEFDRKLIKIAGQHIVDSLLYIINDSFSMTYGYLTNLYADDSMICASGDNILEVQQKLQQCIKIKVHGTKLIAWK